MLSVFQISPFVTGFAAKAFPGVSTASHSPPAMPLNAFNVALALPFVAGA